MDIEELTKNILEEVEEELRKELVELSKKLSKAKNKINNNYVLFPSVRKQRVMFMYEKLLELYDYKQKELEYIQRELDLQRDKKRCKFL